MTTFDDREQAFERMFVHDEDMRFRALARRNKALGQWAAEQLGLSGRDASTYVEEIRKSTVVAQGDEQIVRKLCQDFERAGVPVSEGEVQERMNELLAKAIAQIKSGKA